MGEWLRRLRSYSGQSQSQLARGAGTSQSNVSAYETGERMPSAETLNRLVQASGFRLAAVAKDDEDLVVICDWPSGRRPLPDDPPDEPATLDPAASPAVRGRVLYDLLELSDALRGPRR